jgi:sortase A
MPDIQPLSPSSNNQPPAGFQPPPNKAADLIRSKLDRIYADEPNASAEIQEVEAIAKRSKHQEYMHQLSNSGKDLATVQTEWHNYYIQLTDPEKHQVWQEFYSNSSAPKAKPVTEPSEMSPHVIAEHKQEARNTPHFQTSKATKRPKRDFGLGVGTAVVFVIMFTFFNEAFIAPFIQPSRVASATPIIVDTASVAPSSEPQVIIPKINVQIPVVYDLPNNTEDTVQNALESGIAHYPTTPKPGQKGNAAYFGHSSNNIFNKGKYKFAFVLLHQLVIGDTFYLSNQGKIYVYKVIDRKVVDPSQVEVLDPIAGKESTATLITCDPPGTSLKRLVVVGEQISPDPSTNGAAPEQPQEIQASSVSLPGNGPTLAGRLLDSGIGRAFAIIIVIGALVVTLRWVLKPNTSN